MHAWLLTNTTYGSWLPGDARGSVTSVRDRRLNDPPSAVRIEHDIPGEPCEDAIPELQRSAEWRMSGPPIYLDNEKAEVVLSQFRETATYRGWTLRAVAIMYNHFHIVVQVTGDPHPRKVLADFKAYGTRVLTTKYGRPPSETWWTDKGSKRKLQDEAALFAAISYVLVKQPNPLVVWPSNDVAAVVAASVNHHLGEPRASATGAFARTRERERPERLASRERERPEESR